MSDAIGVGVAPTGLRGIVATRHVSANETLFVITKEVILSSSSAFRGDLDDGEGIAGNETWEAARLHRYPRSEQWDFGLYVSRQRLRGYAFVLAHLQQGLECLHARFSRAE